MSLKEEYKQTIAPKLKEILGYENANAVPKLAKAVVNVGFGKIRKEPKIVEAVETTLRRITGQKPVLVKAKKSISNFKIHTGELIGAKATLRGQRMYDFVEKLVKLTLPRVRDFRGLPLKSVNRGCITLGFKEHIAFPEIRSDEIEKIHGLEVTVVSTANDQKEAIILFKNLGFPLQEK